MKNTNISAIVAAATLALAGVAMAQSTDAGKNAPTSTPGAGCTATANAMKGGNLGGRASNTACGTSDTAGTTANTNTTSSAAPVTSSTTQSSSSNSTSTAGAAPSATSTDVSSTSSATPAPVRRTKRVARADRG